jgi:hypothetical protein
MQTGVFLFKNIRAIYIRILRLNLTSLENNRARVNIAAFISLVDPEEG